MFGDEVLKKKLADSLCACAGELLDLRLQLMQEEIEQGWRCYHARCLWFAEHLPEPLINEMGRTSSIEEIQAHLEAFAEGRLLRRSCPTMRTLIDNPATRSAYRNFLDVGALEVESRSGDALALDLVADEVTRKLLHEQGRHFRFEVRRNKDLSWREALIRGTETPPPMYWPADVSKPVRDPQRALHEDARYWIDVYQQPENLVASFDGVLAPDLTFELMARFAPDFPHDPAASTKRLIVFSRAVSPTLRWCINVGYQGASKILAYPPTLSLASGSKRPRSVFNDVLRDSVELIEHSSPRDVETHLRYWIPRFRKLIDFYSDKFGI